MAMPTYGLCDTPASPSSPRALPRCFPAPPSRRERQSLVCTSGPEAVPPPRRRSPRPRLPPHPLVLVGTGARRRPLRVPAREVSGIRGQLDAVLRHSLKSPAVTIPHGAAVDERQPLRRLRSRARADGGTASRAWSDAVRLQRRAGTPCRRRFSRRSLAWRGGPPVPGATSYHVWFTDIGKVVAIEDERSRRARVLRLPPRAGLHRSHPLACSRRPDDVRHDPLESPPGDVRPVEQGEHVDEPGRRLGAAEARVCDLGRWFREHDDRRTRSSTDAGVHVLRRPGAAVPRTPCSASTSSATASAST